MRIVLWTSFCRAEIVERLKDVAGIDLIVIERKDQLAEEAAQAEALLLPTNFYDRDLADRLRREARTLRWIQMLTSGSEGPMSHGIPPGVALTNAGDAWAPSVAEHAMALLLALVKRLPEIVANQAGHGWQRDFTRQMETLVGRTLAIIGFGHIGREMAIRARACGMAIVGVSRSAQPDPLADEMRQPKDLIEVLGRATAIALCVPSSPQTEGMIGAAELSACRPEALLVNVSRGKVLDSQALADALMRQQIAGAGLDVTDPEPLPPAHPLWLCPNIIISPHVAGSAGPVGRARLAALVADNVARFVSGQPLEHTVLL